MNTVAIVQARLGSSRFPCKIVADLCGKPMISHVLERAAAIKGIDKVVLAIPTGDWRALQHVWPDVFTGDEKDVVSRYAAAASFYGAETIVRITGDCPLLAPDLAERAIVLYHTMGQQYLAFCQPYCRVADGWDVEVFSHGLLERAHAKATALQREHVVTWMREHVPVPPISVPHNYSMMKLSVDTKADLDRVRRVMEFLNDQSDFSSAATWEAWQRAGRP